MNEIEKGVNTMSVAVSDIEARLAQAFEGAEIVVHNQNNDGQHYSARIIWAGFAGLNRVKQHQMVNRALADLLAGPLHALSIETNAG
jgi:stress-induced morphogen